MRNWPLFDLSITTPLIQLRHPSLADLDELCDRAAEGVHDPGFLPFYIPWSEAEPAERARRTLQYHFRSWGAFSVEDWSVNLVAVYEGQVVGTQGIEGANFAVAREAKTGSWLGRRFQSKGIGTEMRRAALQLAFAGLGARHAVTEAFEDNHPSLAVTRKLGYREDGVAVHARKGEPVVTRRFRMAREDWSPAPDIEIHNLAPCLPLFGLDG